MQVHEKRTLRLNLTDFISKPIEDVVTCSIEQVMKSSPMAFTVRLWYSPNLVDESMLETFRQNNTKFLNENKVEIKRINMYEDFVWYDIIHTKDQTKMSKYKFRLTYSDENDIPVKLIEFLSFIKYYPVNLQKNNGYKHENKSSDNRFNSMGK